MNMHFYKLLIFFVISSLQSVGLDHENESHEYVDSDLLVFHAVELGEDGSKSEQFKKRIRDEIERYLRAKPTADIWTGLKDFPIIHAIFMEFNSIRSSEAICERMFSYAGELSSIIFFLIYRVL